MTIEYIMLGVGLELDDPEEFFTIAAIVFFSVVGAGGLLYLIFRRK